MARPLVGTLDALQLAQRRLPKWKVLIYDLRSTSGFPTPSTVNDVVLFNLGLLPSLPAVVGPRDFTDDCLSIAVTELAGDYVNQGIAATSITFQISDPVADFDPVANAAPEDGRWMRQGNVVVVQEGDEQEPEANWPTTFTGKIQGQPGQDRGRTTGESVLSAKASSREVDFIRREGTTRNFDQGSTFTDIATEIAETDMGLDLDEINLPAFGVRFTQFLSTQFVLESPLTSIAKIMFPDGFMPRFEGDGRLGASNGIITKGSERVYSEFELQITVSRAILEFNGTNDVEVIGLDPNLFKVEQERQVLATAGITTGFFSKDTEIPVFWSDDKTQQARGVALEILQSVGASPITFGSEDFTNFIQSDGGSVEGLIEVDGSIGAGILLIGLVSVAWLGSLFIPDVGSPHPPAAPTTIVPFGRSATVIAGKLIMLILGQAGRGEYRVLGIPYEYIFKEIRAVARIKGIRSEDRQSISVENHLINSQADADERAELILRRERAKQNLRTITMIHDLRLEPDDVFALGLGLDQRRYMIQSISRTLIREGQHLATLNCFEVTAGVRP